jgi:MFS family permease
VLLPVLASKMLRGGPETLGMLMAASGVGALTSAMMLALRRSVLGLYAVIASCAALFGLSLILLGLSYNLPLSLLLMALGGFGMMQAVTAISTVIQTIVPDDRRGRVMSYWTMAFMGAAPVGGLLAGALVPPLGEPGTLALCGAGCILSAGWFWTRRDEIRALVRPIYEELGILASQPIPLARHSGE